MMVTTPFSTLRKYIITAFVAIAFVIGALTLFHGKHIQQGTITAQTASYRTQQPITIDLYKHNVSLEQLCYDSEQCAWSASTATCICN